MTTKFIPYDRLKPDKGIPYTRQHLLRLEKAGTFPKRVYVGAYRVAYVEKEIDRYCAERASDHRGDTKSHRRGGDTRNARKNARARSQVRS